MAIYTHDICVSSDVPATQVRRVVTLGEPEFEGLTGSSAWKLHFPLDIDISMY